MSLRWRIALGLALIAGLAVTAAGVASYLATRSQLSASVDDSLRSKVDNGSLVRGGPGLDGDDGSRHPPRGAWMRCPPPGTLQPASAAQLIDPDGDAVPCLSGAVALPVDATDRAVAAGTRASTIRTIILSERRYRLLTAPLDGGVAVQLARDLAEVDDLLRGLLVRLLLLTAVGVAAAGTLGWFVAGLIVRPIRQLTNTAEHIAATDDLSAPIPAGGTGEVGRLAGSFRSMVSSLQQSREQQQRLVSDASHEMRTPLTSLRTNLELLERAEHLPPAERQAVIEDLRFETEELTHLVRELVELATDRASDDEPPEPVQLGHLARAVAERAARRSGRELTVRAGGHDEVAGRPQMLERAISNLVDNAVKYSAHPAPVEIEVDGSALRVLDRGPGIAAEDLPRVFERFYRAAAARTAPGSGLGLAIVAQIVERHGGRVVAGRREGGGAVVGFDLPPAGVVSDG